MLKAIGVDDDTVSLNDMRSRVMAVSSGDIARSVTMFESESLEEVVITEANRST